MKNKVNYQIAFTHILTRKKQTLVAAMGVTIGIALYIFSNSLIKGFTKFSEIQMFKTVPHIRIYKEDKISEPLFEAKNENEIVVISNPKITSESKSIVNPYGILEEIKKQSYVISTAPQINVDLFYNNGKSQLKGVGSGIEVAQADVMFNIQSTMVAGSLQALSYNLNGIIIGSGVAQKMNVGLDDNITVTSSWGVIKVMKVVGVFNLGNKSTDESKSYINIKAAQQLVKEGPNFVTDIYVSVSNSDSVTYYANQLQPLTSYKVEDWQTSNADTLSSNKVRSIMNSSVAFAIMMVAAFGIYNILNMTITQKMNDIAILKASGFKGRDIIKIFVFEAFIMGMIGTFLGLCFGAVLIEILSRVYIGPPTGYFPIYYDASVFVIGAAFGLSAALGAGYFPARKAARIDPVEIFRK